ncbi:MULTISPECIES: lyase family protein [Burkholderia]|uniref:argininosuccinate lyase n=1 Tax=Burkholderia cepacia TaxID=292 RepID=A0AA88YVP4_BURCE|nr:MULTISPECIES: lyase family protein [Burkholderia]KGB91967.1 ATP-grasp domain protein [Burkholderia cepacia]KWE59337.1 argininosuccinate lyase [Burkholderia sp. MSMB2157WGS]
MAIVYIESNTTGFGQSLLDVSLNYDETCFLVRDRARYAFLDRLSPDVRVIDCDTQSVDTLERIVGDLPDVRYVASTSDGFIENVARLSERLGLPGNSEAAVALCRDKLRLQDTLRDHGVPYPYTAEIESANAARKLTYPVIVKPRQGTGSIGVRLVEREQDFPDISDSAFICQRFVPGVEFSVESFSDADGHHVLAVTRKFLTKPPHFLELAHVLPANLDAATHARIVDTVRRALHAVGYMFGPAHTELKVHGDTITIIEINARLAGGMIPRLMERAYGWSIADLYVRSHLSSRSQFVVPTPALHSAVAFVVPEVGRRYVGIDFPDDCADAGLFREEGVNAGKFDFSDRAGYVISFGPSAGSVLRNALSLRRRSRVLYDDPDREMPDRDTIHDIVYEHSPPCFGKLTVNLLAIEKAHLIMLREQSILSAEQFHSLREAVMALEANPALLREHVSGRGDYFDYEQYVISRCGRDTGGMVQAARSRNDINGTHLLLTIRQALSQVTRRAIDLGEALARRAAESADVPLPIYSQYQTAMPGSAAHYLVAQCDILLGTLDALSSLRDGLTSSPLGACAGAGTTFTTDPRRTANLLGFSTGPLNSLSAITDKNPALRCACLLTELSSNLNRIATDLQLWSMREIGIVTLPDGMYGGSSNMPQKRNPYLLEWLRLGHDRIAGHCAGALSSLSHLPTGNSYQASRTAVEAVSAMSGLVIDMLKVLVYAINEIQFDANAARRAIDMGNAGATLVAESLVQQHMASFRDAHAAVSRALSNTPDATQDVLDTAAGTMLDRLHVELESATVFDRLDSGGGPSTRNTRAALATLATRLLDQRRRQRLRESRAAAAKQALDHRFMSIRA